MWCITSKSPAKTGQWHNLLHPLVQTLEIIRTTRPTLHYFTRILLFNLKNLVFTQEFPKVILIRAAVRQMMSQGRQKRRNSSKTKRVFNIKRLIKPITDVAM